MDRIGEAHQKSRRFGRPRELGWSTPDPEALENAKPQAAVTWRAMTAWRRTLRATVLGLAATLSLHPAWSAPDMQVSGFGTLGGALSDQDFTFERSIDDQGTLNRDSLLGVQLDAGLSPAWSLTLQAKIAPATDHDSAWEPRLTWAFLSWRPTNDLLVRAGKLRLPLMLYSANSDVGITFDFARLPNAVYSLLPTTDVEGLAVSKTWLSGDSEWSLEGYAGSARTEWRYFLRESTGSLFPAGTTYLDYDVRMAGLVLSLRRRDTSLRLGLHRADVEWDAGPVPSIFPYVSLAPGIGYYQIADAMPGPGIPYIDSYEVYLLTIGADIPLPRDFRLIGEYGRRRFANATTGPDTNAAYVALLRKIGNWTPYVYWSAIRTKDKPLDLIDALNQTRIPNAISGADAINVSQRMGADLLTPFDQHSWAIGASYSLSPSSKLKLEWKHTQTGRLSSVVDAPAGEDSGDRQVNVFSLSYSFAF